MAQPAHVKNMPGRKSDISDALWIADLLAHGLIRASFVPPTPIQELRELTRTRKQFVREIARETRGTALSIPLHELEELVGPALLLLNNRLGAIIPIRAEYAERLLGTSAQRALFCYEARLLPTRTYYSQIAHTASTRAGHDSLLL